VQASGVVSPGEHLWGDVVRCADLGGHVFDLIVIARQTKVNDLQLTISGGLWRRREGGRREAVRSRRQARRMGGGRDRGEEEVLWLEVTMADVVDGVAVLESTQHRLDDGGGVLFGIVTLGTLGLLDDAIEQLVRSERHE
jgi:hypothetical protein